MAFNALDEIATSSLDDFLNFKIKSVGRGKTCRSRSTVTNTIIAIIICLLPSTGIYRILRAVWHEVVACARDQLDAFNL